MSFPREVEAKLFDGYSSQPLVVYLSFGIDGNLTVRDEVGRMSQYTSKEIICSPPVGRGTLRIRIQSTGFLIEAPYTVELSSRVSEFQSDGVRFVTLAERNWGVLVLLAIAAAFFCVYIYFYGLPLAGRLGAPLVPYSLKELAGDQILDALDIVVLHPSEYGDEKLEELKKSVQELESKASFPYPIHIQLRRLGKDRDVPNALALLPRTIIATDALVSLLTKDELQGVIAHEIGHLVYDHGTQMLIRNSVVSVLSLALFGADPGALQGVALTMLDSQYSQNHERMADQFAVSLLRKVNVNPNVLASALEKMTKGELEHEIHSYISSHPLTSERIAYIRAGTNEQ